MGYAYTAVADDANSIFSNPSGLASIFDVNATSSYANVFNSINYFVLGAAKPTEQGTLGFGFINVSSPPTDIWEFIGGIPVYMGSSSNTNQLFLFTYARKLRDNLFVGGNLKWFKFDLTGGGPSYEAYGSGSDLDLGLKFIPKDWLSIGATVHNALPASMGGRFLWSDGKAEAIPSKYFLGFALRALGKNGIREFRNSELNFSMDFEGNVQGFNKVRFGTEYWPAYPLALRAGLDGDRWSIGAGFRNQGVTFDYAFKNVVGPTSNTSHSISIGYIGAGQKQFENLAHEAPLPSNAVVLKSFADVPKGYFAKEAIEKLASLELMTGFPSGSYKPEDEVTRAELAMILVRALDIPLDKVNGRFIKDLPPDYWPAPYVKTIVKKGIMTTFKDDTFRPNWPIKTKDAVLVMKNFDPSFSNAIDKLPFDVNDKDNLTRAELAYMLFNTDLVQNKLKGLVFK